MTVVRTDSESLALGLLEAAPDAIVIVDEDGRIILVNAQTERIFGYDRNELIGQTVELLIPAVSRRQHVQNRDDFFCRTENPSDGYGPRSQRHAQGRQPGAGRNQPEPNADRQLPHRHQHHSRCD